jgi:hypothetical protein
MNLQSYLGKPIILVTNFFDSPDGILGIRDDRLDIDVFSVNGRFVCLRLLNVSDLEDEDYVQWLHAMWPAEEQLLIFLKSIRPWTNQKSVELSSKRKFDAPRKLKNNGEIK